MIAFTLPEIRRLLTHLVLRHTRFRRACLGLVELAPPTPTPSPTRPLPTAGTTANSTAVAVLRSTQQ